jgi:hypothetical protein
LAILHPNHKTIGLNYFAELLEILIGAMRPTSLLPLLRKLSLRIPF